MAYKFLIWAIWFVAVLIIMTLIFYVLDQPRVTFQNNPFPVGGAPVAQGGTFYVDIRVCSKGSVTYRFTQKLINADTGQVYFLPSQEATSQPGCNLVASIPKVVPDYVPDGSYFLESNVVVPGTLRTHAVEDLRSEVFIIQSM